MTVLHVGGPAGVVRFELGGAKLRAEAPPGARSTPIGRVALAPGLGRLRAWIERPAGSVGAYHVELRRLD